MGPGEVIVSVTVLLGGFVLVVALGTLTVLGVLRLVKGRRRE